jgi:SAM-dependent methyltransferase
MNRLSRLAASVFTSGKDDQSFLGAEWIVALVRRAPRRYRRAIALTVLSWSPHYFYRAHHPSGSRLGHREFTEREWKRNSESRKRLCDLVVAPHVTASDVVIDYGCGPGLLAANIAGRVRKIYGVDISKGTLECARALAVHDNVSFLHTSEMSSIPKGTVDLVYSIAVVQHLTDDTFAHALEEMHTKLKRGGALLFHVVLDDLSWRTEREWREDTSWSGRARIHWGLNCFRRSAEDVRDLLTRKGFGKVVVTPMSELCSDKFDDVCTQHLVKAIAE